MAEDFETVELEYSEDDIVYYILDEDDNEIGFALNENGQEVEYFYEGYDASDYLTETELATATHDIDQEAEGDAIELEIDEDDIVAYLVDEEGNEIGFIIEEDGVEIECYYTDDEDDESDEEDGPDEGASGASELSDATAGKTGDPSYLQKMASIAGFHGNKARKKAEVQLDKARGTAEVQLDKVRGAAEKQVDRAAEAVESGGKKLKSKREDMDLGITREGVTQATEDLNVIAREGAATAKELKETYEELMDDFGFLLPNKLKRRLPH
ncbi:MAG TPA: hypothetical protein DCP91_04595 [Eggerthellaceae bacterium]|nr:hypothetical protein [Eggerthellaceae bacterium]